MMVVVFSVSPALLQKYHHVGFGTTARLLVSITGEKEWYAEVYRLTSSVSTCLLSLQFLLLGTWQVSKKME